MCGNQMLSHLRSIVNEIFATFTYRCTSCCHSLLRILIFIGSEQLYEIMARRIENAEVSVGLGCPSPSMSMSESGVEWKTFHLHIHGFANLSTTKNHFVASPKFAYKGHQWVIRVYPGGYGEAAEGQVSAYLHHLSEERTTIRFVMHIIDKFGKQKTTVAPTKREFSAGGVKSCWGWHNFISRSTILDESQNILDSNGTLTFAVSMEEEPTTAFVPQNPLLKIMKELFNDENTADVCFEVSSSVDGKRGKKKKSMSSVSFYAHRLILEKCAPMLADICGSSDGGGVVTASVNDVKPDIFRRLLSCVYGGSVPKEELKTHAKDIIDVADKYSIVNLKLEAEAVYVEITKLTFDNAIDNLLYADSRNCALLKEAVMNFLADNHREAAANISSTDFPPHVVKDLLIAFGRSIKKDANETNADELTTLSVSELRRKLDSMGLEVDGSREAMIESIKSHS